MRKYRLFHGMMALALLLAMVTGLTYAQGPGPQGGLGFRAAVGTAFT